MHVNKVTRLATFQAGLSVRDLLHLLAQKNLTLPVVGTMIDQNFGKIC